MLTHIVFWKFQQEGKEEHIAAMKAKLEALLPIIPQIKYMQFGTALPGGEWDASLLTRFDSVEAMQEYLQHPEHKKVSAYCKSVRTARTSVDYFE